MKDILIKIIKKYKWKSLLQIVFVFINIYFLTYPATIVGNIVDLLYDIDGNKQEIIKSTYYLLGICVFLLVVRTIWKYLNTYINRAFEKDLKRKLFERFMKIQLSKIQNIKNGELMSYFVKDINEIRVFFMRMLSFGSRIVAILIIATYKMASSVDLKLTIITLCPIFLTSYLVVVIKKYVERSFKKSQEYFTQLSEYVQESTDSIRTTKAYSCEGEQLKEFIRKNRNVKTSNIQVDVHSTLLSTCINICFGLCYGLSLLFGSKLVIENQITIGDFVAFNGYIGLFVGPVSWLPQLVSRYKRSQISYARLDKVFELEREKISASKRNNEEHLQGNIKFNNLTFNYPGCLDHALENIDLEIKKGETIRNNRYNRKWKNNINESFIKII